MDTRLIAGLSLLASVISSLIAVGIISPQPAAPLNIPIVSTTGGHIESAVWTYNEPEHEFHLELTVGMSSYALYALFGSTTFESAKGAYETNAFQLTVDASKLKLAYPMQPDPQGLPYIKVFRCEGQVPHPDIWATIIGAIIGSPTGPIGSMIMSSTINSWLINQQYRQYALEAVQKCSTVSLQPREHLLEQHMYFGVKLVKVPAFTLFGITLSEVTVPQPVVYGYAVVSADLYKPTTAGAFPYGQLTVSLRNKVGDEYSAVINLMATPPESNAPVCSPFSGLGGRVCYSYFAKKYIILDKGDPYLYTTTGADYNLVWAPQYTAYMDTFRSTLSNLKSELPANLEIHKTATGIELPQYTSYDVQSVAQVTSDAWNTLTNARQTVSSALSTLVATDPHEVIQRFGKLVLVLNENPVDTGRFILSLVADIPASAIGMVKLTPNPTIVSATHDINVTVDSPAHLSVTVRNTSEAPGSIQFRLVCPSFTVVGFPKTADIDAKETHTYTFSFTAVPPDPHRVYDETCTLYVSDLDNTYVDHTTVVLHYKPDIYCAPGTYWCDINGSGYYYCQDPYKPKQYQPFTPCPQGQTCVFDPSTGQAKCVSRGTEQNVSIVGTFCKDTQICYVYSNGTTKCQPCDENQVCVVSTTGAKCSTSVPPPPPPGTVYLTPTRGDEQVRVGASLAALGFALLAVILW